MHGKDVATGLRFYWIKDQPPLGVATVLCKPGTPREEDYYSIRIGSLYSQLVRQSQQHRLLNVLQILFCSSASPARAKLPFEIIPGLRPKLAQRYRDSETSWWVVRAYVSALGSTGVGPNFPAA